MEPIVIIATARDRTIAKAITIMFEVGTIVIIIIETVNRVTKETPTVKRPIHPQTSTIGCPKIDEIKL